MDAFGWTDIEDIAIALAESHPAVDPVAVRFDRLRAMVEGLDGFEPDPGHTVNEQILEAIQAAWIEEAAETGGRRANPDDEGGYSPNQPFR